MSQPALSSSRRRTGCAFWFQSMFGLSWKLNSTLYWITMRMHVAGPDMGGHDQWWWRCCSSCIGELSVLLTHLICSHLTLKEQLLCYKTFLRRDIFPLLILSASPSVSDTSVLPLNAMTGDNYFDLVCTATDRRSILKFSSWGRNSNITCSSPVQSRGSPWGPRGGSVGVRGEMRETLIS